MERYIKPIDLYTCVMNTITQKPNLETAIDEIVNNSELANKITEHIINNNESLSNLRIYLRDEIKEVGQLQRYAIVDLLQNNDFKEYKKPKITQLTDETIKAIDESGLIAVDNDYNNVIKYLLIFREINSTSKMSKYELLKDIQNKINQIVKMESN